MQWNEFKDSFPLTMLDTPVLLCVEGEIGIGKLVIEPATKKNPAPTPEWRIFYPAHYKPGSVAPSHWATLPDIPGGEG